ncbi:MAG: LamG domain-containing protein, partial [Candidatus Micrarchaeota archaeon]|nr:LamG domain-containing protein [Candidatus Micrarchaeota archaeon]
IAYVNGTLVSLASFAGPTAPVKVWSKNLGSRPHGLSSSGTDIAFGYGTTAANIINIDGTNVITYSGTTAVYGTSIYKGVAYFQAASNVIAMNLGGTLLWDKGTAATYGTAMNGAYPVEGGQYLYTLWWNGTRDALTAQNLTNGTIMWKTTLPYAVRANPGMILAYGRLYLSDGSKLIAIGMCSGNPNSTLLASAATAYLNGYTGCASAILDSARPQVNYTMQLDRKSTIHTAKFNGVSSYIDVPNSQTLDNASAMSFSFWVNNAGGGTVLSKAHPSPELGQYWITITSGIVHYAIKQYWGDYNTGAAVPANTWTHVALVVSPSTTNALVYINGMLKSTQTNINNVPFAHGSTDLDIGRQNPENGGGGYFNGSLADVQIYNTSLTGAQVAQLYSEGMSGAPLTGAGVVGWWPLGGDANDYSGLYNSGFPVNVTYTSNSYSIGSLKNSYQASSSTIALPILNYTSMKYETHNVSIISWS